MQVGNRSVSGNWFLGPPRLWTIVALAITAAWMLYRQSFPPLGFVPTPLRLYGYLPTALLCLLFAGYVLRLLLAVKSHNLARRQWHWYPAPILVALTLLAGYRDWPLRLRFGHSRASFEAAASDLLKTETARGHSDTDEGRLLFAPYSRQLGTYSVNHVCVDTRHQAVYFMTAGYFRGGWGFVRHPDGRDLDFGPALGGEDDCVRTRPLAPGWKTFAWTTP